MYKRIEMIRKYEQLKAFIPEIQFSKMTLPSITRCYDHFISSITLSHLLLFFLYFSFERHHIQIHLTHPCFRSILNEKGHTQDEMK